MDIRVGTILEAEKAKSKQIVILKIDTGIDVRTIVSELQRVLNRKI
jgi:methionyl-tRNA synthetase